MSERHPFVAVLVNELPIKILSLLIAVTLFVLVRSDKDATSATYAKVIYSLPKDRVLISDPVTKVRVTVRGPWTRLQRLLDQEIEPIVVDLAFHSGGKFHFDENLVKLPSGLHVSAISPSEVYLEFEPKLRREITLQPLLEGDPADGYRVARVTASPATLWVEGNASAVEGLKRIRLRPLRISGGRGPVRGEVAVATEGMPSHVTVEGAPLIAVEADIRPAIVERVFDGLAVHVAGLTRLDSATAPGTVKIIVRGPSDVVAGVLADTLIPTVDATLEDSRGPGISLKHVVVNGVPTGAAAEVQPDSIKLTLRRK